MSDLPRITFGIIVFNGEPFVRYNLRALYPFAYQILVVEGACLPSASLATADGHSTDGTLEALYQFKNDEDKDNKLQIIVQDRLWSEKDEQSRAYAEKATGDYLWQVDIDEFYQPDDMIEILKLLKQNSSISGASVKQITFWGGFDYLTDGFYLRNGAAFYRRIFRWGPGYSYATHRPPTVIDSNGIDVFKLNWLNAQELASRNIFLYHYSLLFPKQVFEKCEYYRSAAWADRRMANQWLEDVYLKLRSPFRVHNVYDYPSWLEYFRGDHPPQVKLMRNDIETGNIKVNLRQTKDIEKLLRSPIYQTGRSFLILGYHIQRKLQPIWLRFIYRVMHPFSTLKNLIRKSFRKLRIGS